MYAWFVDLFMGSKLNELNVRMVCRLADGIQICIFVEEHLTVNQIYCFVIIRDKQPSKVAEAGGVSR